MTKKTTATKFTRTYVLPETGQVIEAGSAAEAIMIAKESKDNG